MRSLWLVLSSVLLVAGCTSFGHRGKDEPGRADAGTDAAIVRWALHPRAGITWDLGARPAVPHSDHLAMSGRKVDMILEWDIDEQGHFSATRVIRWPMLRTIPNDTHASLELRFPDSDEPKPLVVGRPLSPGRTVRVDIDGTFGVVRDYGEGVSVSRTIFPSVASPAVVDDIELTNNSDTPLEVTIPSWHDKSDAPEGVLGKYVVEQLVIGEGEHVLAPGETLDYAIVRTARLRVASPYFAEPKAELAARRRLIASVAEELILETPEPVLNRMFTMAKVRAVESIFSTRGGLMHGPGGYNKYLAAIWANDQAEYVNPFFPFLGSAIGNESAMNSFRHFARFVSDDYQPIPSSIIAEGVDVWDGAGDRGDQAMIAYGAARFALASGNRAWAEELWPLIEWCLEYCRLHKTAKGVVASDTDELEGRFPAGQANLCTATLYYDALLRASRLAQSLGKGDPIVNGYRAEASDVRTAIRRHFEADVEGFPTYRYYDGNTILRSWICIPLCAGMTERVGGTVEALFSPRLWMGNGLLTRAGEKTYWDRSTLYALRGVLFCGAVEEGLPKLLDYSRERLLGAHVPYAIEAFPEYDQSHLSAESGLYCRVFTEGLFGIVPTGLRRFECTPRLPRGWNHMALRRVHAFGRVWDLEASRAGRGVRVEIFDAGGRSLYAHTLPEGESHVIDLRPTS